MTSGTMMEFPLTLDVLVRRAEQHFPHVEVVSRKSDRGLHRTTLGAVTARAWRLARALLQAGLAPGDKVATLMWNHAVHLEAYLGIPLARGVVHTLNLRLSPEDLAFIVQDAGDRFLVVDASLLPLLDKLRAAGAGFETILVVGAEGLVPEGMQDYEHFLADAPEQTSLPALEESDALGCCYTSGTTGRPKGVAYTHRSTLLHSLVSALPDALSLSRADTLMPVVPMFHVNAWGLPYTATMMGTKLVFPGPFLDPHSLLDLLEQERVTVAAGVPTLWLGIREVLEGGGRTYRLQPGLRMIVGGSAAPEQLIRDFDRLGMRLLHAWGMTEISPLGLVSRLPPELDGAPEDVRYAQRAKQGVPPPLVELEVRNDQGRVPPDGKTSGEVMLRGPWVAARYLGANTPERWTAEGYFRTGDVARVDAHGFVEFVDRMADLIKSGGEWIASQQLENALMGHPAVKEAAVIGVPDAKWMERPLAVVVLKPGARATPDELRAFLAPRFPKFWLPDRVELVEAIPRTSAGKFLKTALRAQYRT